MRVTDQIDALSTLSTNPMKYLVAPRLLAGLIALPLLVVVADILGVLGGFIIATAKLGFNATTYLSSTLNFVQTDDVVSGLAKAAVFGVLITLMGCYQGYNSKGGAQGVGAATTSAVVAASVLILAFDYVLTELFFAR
jgi:phospholipid/cholesterol/gamma-HCH transport system permease protein